MRTTSSKRPRSRVLAVAFVVLSVWVVPSLSGAAEPTAAEKETARTLMKRGDALYNEQRDYAGALEAYRAAHAIMGVPTTGIALARALDRVGKLVEARDVALEVSRYPEQSDEPPPYGQARRDGANLAADLVDRIPSLAFRADVAPGSSGITIELDGKVLPAAAWQAPWKLNPGKHQVHAKAQGYSDVALDVTLSERQHQTLVLPFKPAPRPSPAAAAAPVRTGPSPAAWVALGIGAAGVLVGGVTGVVAWRQTSSLKDRCTGGVCLQDTTSDYDAAHTFATVSNVAFAVGAVGIATGIVLLVVTRGRSPSAHAGAAQRSQPFGLNGLRAGGAF